MSIPEKTLIEHLARHAAERGEAPFLNWQTGSWQSYAETYERVRRLAGGLSALGIAKDSPVLIWLPNSLEIVESWFACAFLGAWEVPVNIFLRGDFLRHIIVDSTADTMIAHVSLLPYLERIDRPAALKRLIVVGGKPAQELSGLEIILIDSLMGVPLAGELAAPCRVPDVHGIFYTSGTTGPAKGVLSTYGLLDLASRNHLNAIRADGDDVFYCCMPLFHANAQMFQIAAPLRAGARVSIWPEFSASQWLDQIRAVGATVTHTLGVMAEFVYRQPPRPDDAENPLRVVQTIPGPKDIVADFELRFGVTCIDAYGLSDAGMVAYRRYDEPLVPGSAGRLIEDYEVVIADPETDMPLPVGETGQILIRPKVPFAFPLGYWRRPDATAEAWRNLWMHTGDAGMIDDAGLLYFRDRLKDSIRVKGENISSMEVEAVMLSHPRVHQCAAVGVVSEFGDQDILAVLVLNDTAPFDPLDLVRHCEGRMPYYAVPRYFDVTDALPMTGTQKVQKAALRERGVVASTWDRQASGYRVSRT